MTMKPIEQYSPAECDEHMSRLEKTYPLDTYIGYVRLPKLVEEQVTTEICRIWRRQQWLRQYGHLTTELEEVGNEDSDLDLDNLVN